MNVIHIIPMVGVLLVSSLSGQTSDGMEDFRLRIQKSSTGQDAQDVIHEAFQEGGMDKLKICFSAPQTSSLFLRELDKKEVSPLKDQIILMMLRTPSPFDKKGKNDAEVPPPAFPLGMYISAKYVNERLGYDVVDLDDKRAVLEAASSPAQRELLAKRLESVMASKNHEQGEELSQKKEPRQIDAKSQKGLVALDGKRNSDAAGKPGGALFWISLWFAIFVFIFAAATLIRAKIRKAR